MLSHRSENCNYDPSLVWINKVPKRFYVQTTSKGTTGPKVRVSQHHKAPIRGPPKTPRTSQQFCTEGFKGGPQFGQYQVERIEPQSDDEKNPILIKEILRKNWIYDLSGE